MHQLAWVRLMVARHPWTYWLVDRRARRCRRYSARLGQWPESMQHADRGANSSRCGLRRSQSNPDNRSPLNAVMVPLAVVPASCRARHTERMQLPDNVLGAGEIVTDSDVSASGTAALVPDGWVAFVVPASVDHFAVGDHLNVYSVDQLVAAGLVVDVGESELMVAIPAASAPALSAALLADAVTLGLTP